MLCILHAVHFACGVSLHAAHYVIVNITFVIVGIECVFVIVDIESAFVIADIEFPVVIADIAFVFVIARSPS